MIKLFITDLDGCISDPFITPHWESFSRVRQLNLNSKLDENIPPLTICTGRPMPYAEAMAQVLGVELPFLFESGGGMYDVKVNRLEWNPVLNDDRKSEVNEIKAWAKSEVIAKIPNTISEFAKFTDIGIIHQDKTLIEKVFEKSRMFIAANYPHFEVHQTDVSVNIILKKANKGEGIRWMSKKLNIPLEQIAYIGDSSGDIPGLKIVGRPFAPKNASEAVKQVAVEMKGNSTKAVLEAYHRVIEENLASQC